MISLKVFSITEFRDQVFKVFNMVAEGEEVVITRKDSDLKFRLSLLKEEGKSDKEQVLKQLAKTNLKSKSPEEIKQILEDKLKI